MAVSQKLTLTQLENQGYNYQVRVVWLSTQTGSSYNDRQRTAYLYYSINGGPENTVTFQYTLPLRTEKVILDTVVQVPQLPDGSGMLSVRTWMNTHISAGVVELSEEIELKPVASTITAGDALIGSASPIKVYRNGTDFTHSIQYEFGSQSGYLTEDGSISAEEIKLKAEAIQFLIPESFYAEIPDTTQETCHLYCRTYSEDQQIGDVQETSFIAAANEDACKPDVIGQVVDINDTTKALTGNDNVLIRYHSTAECTITVEPRNYASITKRWIDGLEMTEETSRIFLAMQQEIVMFLAQDSRGYSNAYLGEYELIPYTHLTGTPQVERDDPTSGNATLRYSGFFYDGSFGAVNNDLTFEYQIDSGEFVPAEIEYSVADGRYTAEVKLSGLDYKKVFNITARVSDRLETVEKKLTLKKGIPVFDWGENDFAFRVPVQMDSSLNVDGVFSIGGKALLDLFYPVNTVYLTITEDNPADLFGGTWEQLQSDEETIFRWKRTG